MSESNRRLRLYAGLAFVIVAYVAGIAGWSWAVLTVESDSSSPDSIHTRVEAQPSRSAAENHPASRPGAQ